MIFGLSGIFSIGKSTLLDRIAQIDRPDLLVGVDTLHHFGKFYHRTGLEAFEGFFKTLYLNPFTHAVFDRSFIDIQITMLFEDPEYEDYIRESLLEFLIERSNLLKSITYRTYDLAPDINNAYIFNVSVRKNLDEFVKAKLKEIRETPRRISYLGYVGSGEELTDKEIYDLIERYAINEAKVLEIWLSTIEQLKITKVDPKITLMNLEWDPTYQYQDVITEFVTNALNQIGR